MLVVALVVQCVVTIKLASRKQPNGPGGLHDALSASIYITNPAVSVSVKFARPKPACFRLNYSIPSI
jgi:hypothetical protein